MPIAKKLPKNKNDKYIKIIAFNHLFNKSPPMLSYEAIDMEIPIPTAK